MTLFYNAQGVWSQTPEQIYAQGQVVKQNMALFRVVDNVYTLDEVKKLTVGLRNFSCALSDSVVFKAFNLKALDLVEIGKLKYQATYPEKILKTLDTLRIIEKIHVYIEAQNVTVTQSVYGALKSSAEVNRCSTLDFEAPMTKKNIKMEIYFRSRFLDQAMVTNSVDSKQQIQQFIDSVEKQIFHEKYY
ncbi:MAG: hypothetical protein JNM93_02590 [Bacteriovoracaceae bacterium]|nr:hypothetical protein [Bacteriovoracaceae bacterium]